MATMVMAGPSCFFTVERPGRLGSLPPSDPKLGKVTTVVVLPPRTSTPGTAGAPVVASPAPPGPGVGEIPPLALGSEPRPTPVLPAPEPAPVKPLPEPSPLPMPEPPPVPPRPGLSPPPGERASEPLLPPPGVPTLEPGSDEITIPELSLFPPAPLGGARAEPTSPGPPRPEPLLPEPLRPEPEPIDGGGGTILSARSVPLGDPPEVPDGEPWPLPATDGGGGITFGPPRVVP